MKDTPQTDLSVDEKKAFSTPPPVRGIYWIALASSAIGFGLIILLNLATPLEKLRSQLIAPSALVARLTESHVMGSILLAVLLLVCCPPLLIFMRVFLNPLIRYFQLIRSGGSPTAELRHKARRRLLNLQFVIIPLNLILWIALPLALYFTFHLAGRLDMRTALILPLRATMAGFLSAGIMSLWIESYTRHQLIPFLFPEGRLAELKGVGRFSVAKRLRLYLRLGSFMPMVILLVTLLTLHWQLKIISISVRDYSYGILAFVLLLFGVFSVVLTLFNKIINRSILGPVDHILTAVNAVRSGDLGTPVKVVSNDELGVLGDAVNEMIQGLRDRQIVMETFGKYVTPAIRDEILCGRIPLDGELKQVTVLFCDLRDFTPLVASVPPREAVQVINGYFEEMAQAIHGQGGLVLQFIGDEIEAVFGAPLVLEQHACAAAAAALEMNRRLVQYNTLLGSRGMGPLRHGIGIHTGQVIAANIGSSQRLSYALVGDTVNLASRLEGLSKELGRAILLSAATRDALTDRFRCESLITVQLKGLTESVEVFSLTDGKDQPVE